MYSNNSCYNITVYKCPVVGVDIRNLSYTEIVIIILMVPYNTVHHGSEMLTSFKCQLTW